MRGGTATEYCRSPFDRGLYCHAVSKVGSAFPAPGKTFRATVGVDSNEQTSGGRGSVVFVVRVGDRRSIVPL